jgi:hypothetical protein
MWAPARIVAEVIGWWVSCGVATITRLKAIGWRSEV